MTVETVFHIRMIDTPEEKAEALAIRRTVFVDEQGVTEAGEFEGDDECFAHWLVTTATGEAIATARLTDKGNGLGKVERVAVLAPYRKHGIGRQLLLAMEADAKAHGFSRLMLHGQVVSQGFYEKLGYRAASEETFVEEGILHRVMEKSLSDL